MLVVGSGGREHALGWKLAASPRVDAVYTAPGNGGTENNVPIAADDLGGLADFAADRGCLTVVGPEAPLAMGIVDLFAGRGLRVFGPTKAAARLESSKEWAKEFMARNGIPTARFGAFGEPGPAHRLVDSLAEGGGVVVKADGLAAGKGVVVCGGADEAHAAVDRMLVSGEFGGAGSRIVVEERLEGEEASYIAMCDGEAAVPMASSRDHKRALDGDRGPNTGGMGAYSPAPAVEGEETARAVREGVIERAVAAMRREGCPFSGFLYAGVMVGADGRPSVLEFNARMGDPECQPIVMRMDFDLFEYVEACAEGRLASMPPPRWLARHAACVVVASRGYPGRHDSGGEISGLDRPPARDVRIFHAGTRREGGRILASGGRVLGVAALGDSLRSAVSAAYGEARRVSWPGSRMRSDIGAGGPAREGGGLSGGS